jgi:pyruvate dehydrogenase E2 component (dihydrolipoamide acetyltransferase)
MAVEIFIPKMSDHMESGEIVDWLAAEGDRVEAGQGVLEIMTDKVTAEVEAPASGVLRGIRKGAEKGTVVPVGETIAFIAETDDEKLPELSPLTVPASGAPSAAPVVEKPGAAVQAPVNATPVAVKLAERYGLDLAKLRGSGPGGRIRKEDVLAARPDAAGTEAAGTETAGTDTAGTDAARTGIPPSETLPDRVKASPAARRRARETGIDIRTVEGTGPDGLIREKDVIAQESAPAPAAGDRWVELTPIQKMTGERMLHSVTTAPQFSLEVTADAEKLLWIREGLTARVEAETGKRLSITTLLVKITASALRAYPAANTSFDSGRLKQHAGVNVNVAVGGQAGLAAPVIKQADRKPLGRINAEIKLFEEKMKTMRFTREELSGGHFTVSNLGMYGIDRFRAIVNPPQSAILACGRIIRAPVGAADGTIVLRPVMNLTLTVDHRCMDGVQGAQFLSLVKQLIENPVAGLSGVPV